MGQDLKMVKACAAWGHGALKISGRTQISHPTARCARTLKVGKGLLRYESNDKVFVGSPGIPWTHDVLDKDVVFPRGSILLIVRGGLSLENRCPKKVCQRPASPKTWDCTHRNHPVDHLSY
jgi:hypothetical protein